MKKKIIGLLLVVTVLVMTVALTACGLAASGSNKADTSSGDITLDSCYALAVENGFEGTMEDFLKYIKGDSAYDIAVKNGFEGTEKEWLAYLKGQDGMDGTSSPITAKDLFDEAQAQGFTGTYFDFLKQYLNATDESESVSNSKAKLATVSVYCSFDVTYSTFTIRGYQTGTQIGISGGSGAIYSMNKEQGSAYIITNYHVVYNADSEQGISDKIFVYLYGSEIIGNELYTEEYAKQKNITGPDYRGMGIEATYVGGSQHYDIAVLYVENSDILKNSNAVAADFADSNDVVVSQTAYVVGNAEGEGISVTKGVVSVDSENLQMVVADSSEVTSFRVIRVDAAINFGNSGGGVFDTDGNLIGIVNAKTNADGVENIGYALPSNVVKYIAENILYYKNSSINKNYDVRKCMLGISVSSRQSSAVLDDEGKVRLKEQVMIVDVLEDGLASGKLQAGDIITSIKIHHNDEAEGYYTEYTVDRTFVIVDLMLTMRVGDTLKLVYERTTDGTTTQGEEVFVMTEECINEVS